MFETNLEKVIIDKMARGRTEIIGYIASEPYELHDLGAPGDPLGGPSNWLWAVDVEVDGEVVRAVPIATMNRDIFYADIGRSVNLQKINRKWTVVGLAKVKQGRTLVVYLSFADDQVQVVDEIYVGVVIRRLTYEELGGIPGGYGIFPYGAVGRFDVDGNFVELVQR